MAGESYIGSLISLISLSDIRYVGILHSINPQDSTVGLKEVRSFGTEGRRGKSEEEIRPSDNVFDYVVFRGSDIKDLQVFEAPKPTPPVSVPQDPAIMSMGYPPASANTYNKPYAATSTPPVNDTYWSPAEAKKAEKSKLEQDTLGELKAELDEVDTMNEEAIEELAKKVSEMHTTEEVKVNTSTRRNDNYRGRGRPHNSNYRQQKKEFSIPNSEFDFEASNAKFDKTDVQKDTTEEEEQVVVPDPEEFYDKSSSFFDNISCESKERSEQQNEPRRNHFYEERKLNMETFGQATIDQNRYRGNFRGNNGYNNRGGYYRNNRNNYNNNRQYNNNNNNRQFAKNQTQTEQ